MTEKTAPLITIFSAPKPFTDDFIAMLQRNAIQSWKQLGNEIEIVLIGDEDGIEKTAREMGVRHISNVQKNAEGTPLVSSIFQLARNLNQSHLLAYINADIIIFPDFLSASKGILSLADKFMVVGQRWDLAIQEHLDFKKGWADTLMGQVRQKGSLHRPLGSDYFIFPRKCFTQIPDFAIGRSGWDNWMIFKGRWEGWKVIDATGSINIIHQDHDYRHLPGGKPHYRLPESNANIEMAGGRRAIFNLIDSNRVFSQGAIERPKMTREKILREIEIFPLVSLHSFFLSEVFYWLFHFRKAFWEWRASLKKKKADLED